MYPLTVSGAGIVVCLITNFFATDFFPVTAENDIVGVSLGYHSQRAAHTQWDIRSGTHTCRMDRGATVALELAAISTLLTDYPYGSEPSLRFEFDCGTQERAEGICRSA